ncbi:putative RNA-directed DNA polymerase [Tanacetum coccineum]
MVGEDEHQRNVTIGKKTTTEMAALQVNRKENQPQKKSWQKNEKGGSASKTENCTNCGKDGHSREGCFELIGYPDWWPRKARKENFKPKAAVADPVSSPIHGLTNEQYGMFLKFFGDCKKQNQEQQTPQANMACTFDDKGYWGAMDSGATDHMIYQKEVLGNVTTNENETPITVANEIDVPVKGNGEVFLKGGIKINGLSVRRLTRDLYCAITFFPDFFVMQGLRTRSLIGAGNCINGLYRMGVLRRERKAMADQFRLIRGGSAPTSPPTSSAPAQDDEIVHEIDHHVTSEDDLSRHHENDDKWQDAMKKEIRALQQKELPQGKKAIDSKWVYKINNYEDVVDQLDVNNTFLHGDLEEEVYMKIPQGFKSEKETRVCRLRKSIYGLKQASQNWYHKFTKALVEMGYTQSIVDPSLFIYKSDMAYVATLIYVDDVIIVGDNMNKIQGTKTELNHRFTIKYLGTLKYFLGIEVVRTRDGIVLSQRKYTLDILRDMGLEGCRPSAFPMEQGLKLDKSDAEERVDAGRYRLLIGRLLYLQATGPHIAYSVNLLSQFVADPRQPHLDAAFCVVRYLKTTLGQGILLPKQGGTQLISYCDSDWMGCPFTRRSRTGYLLMLGGAPVSLKSKKQSVVSQSSAEAEYRAMATTVSEVLWFRWLLTELDAPQNVVL